MSVELDAAGRNFEFRLITGQVDIRIDEYWEAEVFQKCVLGHLDQFGHHFVIWRQLRLNLDSELGGGPIGVSLNFEKV